MRYLLNFTDQFEMALALWPFASVFFTLPILAYIYHRDGRLRFWPAMGAYISVLYVMGLACFTLYPLPEGPTGLGFTYGVEPQLDFWAFIGDIQRGRFTDIAQLVANVVLFVPFGYILGRAFGRGFFGALIIGFLGSLLVETTQLTGIWGYYDYSYRAFDVDDLLTNTIGSVIGWLFSQLFAKVLPREEVDEAYFVENPGLIRRTVALLLDFSLMFAILIPLYGVWWIASMNSSVVPEPTDSYVSEAMFWIVFLVIEGLVPAFREGRTPGCGFVHTTCEGVNRRGFKRLIYYVLRTAALALLWIHTLPTLAVLLLYYLIRRRMPYDEIPASKDRSLPEA